MREGGRGGATRGGTARGGETHVVPCSVRMSNALVSASNVSADCAAPPAMSPSTDACAPRVRSMIESSAASLSPPRDWWRAGYRRWLLWRSVMVVASGASFSVVKHNA